jgi:hypothetical protein
MREFLRDFARRRGGNAEEGVTSAVPEEAALGSRPDGIGEPVKCEAGGIEGGR